MLAYLFLKLLHQRNTIDVFSSDAVGLLREPALRTLTQYIQVRGERRSPYELEATQIP